MSIEKGPNAFDDFEENSMEVELKEIGPKDNVAISGKSITSHGEHVSVAGSVSGMSLHFVEEKKGFGTLGSTSSCIIDARLSLDGTRFDGVYLNLNDNSMGNIAGISADKEVKDLCVLRDFSPSQKR